MTTTREPSPQTAPGPRERRVLEARGRQRRRLARALLLVLVAAAVAVGAGLRAPGSDPGAAQGVAPIPTAGPARDVEPAGGVVARVGDGQDTGGTGQAAADADAPAASDAPADDRVRLQLLNGVGRPGIAGRVAQRLPEDEFRVVVTDNAPEFGMAATRLLVYAEDPAAVAAAERLRDLLGVGTISVSRQPQSVVDVTVIIGRDILGS